MVKYPMCIGEDLVVMEVDEYDMFGKHITHRLFKKKRRNKMKVLEPGTGQKGWAKKYECTGNGNNMGGCGAILRVEQNDIYLTYSHSRDDTTTYVTFECCECGVLTDIPGIDVPYNILNTLKGR